MISARISEMACRIMVSLMFAGVCGARSLNYLVWGVKGASHICRGQSRAVWAREGCGQRYWKWVVDHEQNDSCDRQQHPNSGQHKKQLGYRRERFGVHGGVVWGKGVEVIRCGLDHEVLGGGSTAMLLPSR